MSFADAANALSSIDQNPVQYRTSDDTWCLFLTSVEGKAKARCTLNLLQQAEKWEAS